METNGDALLPSILHARYNNRSGNDAVDHESLLTNLFSLLSTLGDIASCFDPRSFDKEHHSNIVQNYGIVAWIYEGIRNNTPSSFNSKNHDGSAFYGEGSLLYEWSTALQYIHDLTRHIAPFELHILASQSILFSEAPTTSYRILCLLLCTHSLQQCPFTPQKRWKRWQSLVCETLRIFQDSLPVLDDNNLDVDSSQIILALFIHHILPSSCHVIDQLPTKNSYHVAMFSALVGTSCTILERKLDHCQERLSKGTRDRISIVSDFKEWKSIIYQALLSTRLSFERFGVFSEMTVWIDPMLKFIDDDEANRNEDVDFLMHRDNLSWWACIRSNDESEERVANMDTSINDVGLALLAMKAFQERPKVYRPNFVWKVWFPHVVALFRKSGECPVILEHSTSLFLESLVQMVRENSLVAEKVVHRQPDAPVELFILLSNRLMSRAQTNPSGSGKEETRTASHIDEEGQFKMRSQRTVGLIKELLNRFTAVSRVHIVKKFLQQCPTPGLQARFLDLLRPLILTSDIQAKKLLSELLLSIVDNLFNKHWDRKKQNLIGIDLLIDRSVEISIGAITMIQMWCMVHENEFMADLIGIGYDLQGFHAAMKKQLKWWLENPSDAPKSHFRLFLLDNAIESALEQFAVQKSTSAQGNGIQ